MSNRFKVVAVNGSPHAGIGNTSIMIEMMKPVLAEEGVDLEQILLAEKRIEYCVGCGVCLEKGKCWRQDDHGEIVARILAADGVILASPVYFTHVTAQMKAFIDRSLAYGHKPRATWKPGMAISVSAGMAETATADYLANMLHVYGAFSIGTLTAIATSSRRVPRDGADRGEGEGPGPRSCTGDQRKTALSRHGQGSLLLSLHGRPGETGEGFHARRLQALAGIGFL